MITMWHSGYGDTTQGIYLSKNIHMLKSYPFDFQVCNKAVSVWGTCPYNNNLMKHFTWKRRKCSVMKRKTTLSMKYICRNKKLKIFYAYEYESANYYLQHSKSSKFWHLFFYQLLNSKFGSLMKFIPTSRLCLLHFC